MIVFETALDPVSTSPPRRYVSTCFSARDTSSYCNYKGYATYWSAVIGDDVIGDVAWSYGEPLPKPCQSEDISASIPTGSMLRRNALTLGRRGYDREL